MVITKINNKTNKKYYNYAMFELKNKNNEEKLFGKVL